MYAVSIREDKEVHLAVSIQDALKMIEEQFPEKE
jgi:hypothetical protein